MAKIILKKIYFSLGAFIFNINQEKLEKNFKPEKILTCFKADARKPQECNSKDYHCYSIPKLLSSDSSRIL